MKFVSASCITAVFFVSFTSSQRLGYPEKRKKEEDKRDRLFRTNPVRENPDDAGDRLFRNTPELTYVSKPRDENFRPHGLCEGDCNTDNHCRGELVCFERSAFELVPGCSGYGLEEKD